MVEMKGNAASHRRDFEKKKNREIVQTATNLSRGVYALLNFFLLLFAVIPVGRVIDNKFTDVIIVLVNGEEKSIVNVLWRRNI